VPSSLKQALPLYEQLLQKRRAKLGEDHADTLETISDLAVAYRTARKWDQALQCTRN